MTTTSHASTRQAPAETPRRLSRLSVNINNETAHALNELARGEGTTVTEIIRRAVSVYKYLEDEQKAGGTVQVLKGDERTTLAFL